MSKNYKVSGAGDELQFYSKIKKIFQVTKNVDEGGAGKKKKHHLLACDLFFSVCVQCVIHYTGDKCTKF